jgi:hypothetical protein
VPDPDELVIHFDAVNRYSLPTEPGDLASSILPR